MMAGTDPRTAHESWRTLLRLLALPLAISATLVTPRLANQSLPFANIPGPELLFAAAPPVSTTVAVLALLRGGRALVLPTPLMMWLVSTSQRAASAPLYVELTAHVACFVLLAACVRSKRTLAQGAALCCGAAAIWLQVSGVIHQG